MPFATVPEYEAALADWKKREADKSKEGIKQFKIADAAFSDKHAKQKKFKVPPALVGMWQLKWDIMHLTTLNGGKQIDKQSCRRHCDAYTLAQMATFYNGMGAGPIKLVNKTSGQMKCDWFKASKYHEMVCGSRSFPGGMPAWGASLVLLIGECKNGVRNAVQAGEPSGIDLMHGSRAVGCPSAGSARPGESLEDAMKVRLKV